MRLPEGMLGVKPATLYGWVIGVNTNGEVVHNFQDPRGNYDSITSVNEFDGWLYLGSIDMTSVGRFAVP